MQRLLWILRLLFIILLSCYARAMKEDIKLIIFDLNGTLIDEHSWPKLHAALGITEEEDLVLFHLNQEGIIPSKVWTEIVNNLYQKRGRATKEIISNALLDYSYLPGAKEIIMYLKQYYKVALISGAPDLLVEAVANDLDVDLFASNALMHFDATDQLTELVVLDEEPAAKAIQLQEFCRRFKLTPSQVACVGDGANDIELFKLTKHGITFAGSKVESQAWKIVENLLDIKAIL